MCANTLSRRARLLFSVLLVLSGSGCGSENRSTSDAGDASRADAPDTAGQTIGAGFVARGLGAAQYRIRVLRGEGIEVDVLDAQSTLMANVRLSSVAGMTLNATLTTPDGVVAHLSRTANPSGDGDDVVLLDTRLSGADESFFVDALVRASGDVDEDWIEERALRVPVSLDEAGTLPTVGSVVFDGDVTYARLMLDGEEGGVDGAVFTDWLSAVGADVLLADAAVALLYAVSTDVELVRALAAEAAALGLEPHLTAIHLSPTCGNLFNANFATQLVCEQCAAAWEEVTTTGLGIPGLGFGWIACNICLNATGLALGQIVACLAASEDATTQADCDEVAKPWQLCTVQADEHGCDCSCDPVLCLDFVIATLPPEFAPCTSECSADACSTGVAACGDAVINRACPLTPSAVEVCDPNAEPDGCPEGQLCLDCRCQPDTCGNEGLDDTEQCDASASAGCAGGVQCDPETCACGDLCGNYVIDDGEDCDWSVIGNACLGPEETCTRSCICRERPGCSSGCSAGDPHLITLDALLYDFQAVGEYVLVETTGGDPALLIQVRTEALSSGLCPSVSYNTAVAILLDGARVALYANTPGEVLVDGVPRVLEPGDVEAVGTNGLGTVRRAGARTWVFSFPDGSHLRAYAQSGWLDLDVDPTPQLRGRVQGLLGNFDGMTDNDLTTRGGDALTAPISNSALYQQFGDSFRITAAESLFDYGAAESTQSYQLLDTPSGPASVADLPVNVRLAAETACLEAGVTSPALLQACTLDVGCSDDPAAARWAVDATPPLDVLEVQWSDTFAGWTVESPPGDPTWTLSDDGETAQRTQNDRPGFMVSADAYLGVVFEVTLRVDNPNDDDYIGIAFGYNGPLADNGDADDAYDMLLLSWKKTTQGFGGVTAEEGLSLALLSGPVVDPLNTFWGQLDELPQYRVLATDYGETLGWEFAADHHLRVEYAADRLRLVVDDRDVFDLTPTDVGLTSFPEGRFAF